jgi:hypothetical protein
VSLSFSPLLPAFLRSLTPVKKDFADAAKPQLLTAGMSDEDADRLIYGVKREMSGSTNMYVRMHYAWALRKTAEQQEKDRLEKEALEKGRTEQGNATMV